MKTAGVVLTLLASLSLPGGTPEKAFRNPPPEARPQTWWHWMNGNVTREGITADLEAMTERALTAAWAATAIC